jgi:hypothetical protein
MDLEKWAEALFWLMVDLFLPACLVAAMIAFVINGYVFVDGAARVIGR